MALRTVHRLRHYARGVIKPHIRGVSVLVIDSEGRVLLVRHSYGRRSWALPGGGCGRGEDMHDCARRELREELGLDLASLTHLWDLQETLSGAPHTAHVFEASAANAPVPDGREILAAQYFSPDALPEDTGPMARRRIAMWQEGSRPG
ncbi:MAG: NUDIX domain-containing protein [Sphingomonadaceae bacterium]